MDTTVKKIRNSVDVARPLPLEEVVVLGHSMGGLVARSACHCSEVMGHAWRRKLGKLVCLGSPHHGAPFERSGHWVDVLLGASRYSAPLARLGQIRSAGVTEMRLGNVLDEDGRGLDPFGRSGDSRRPLPLPEGVECYAIAATAASRPGASLPSDGLVPVDSAGATRRSLCCGSLRHTRGSPSGRATSTCSIAPTFARRSRRGSHRVRDRESEAVFGPGQAGPALT